jgi:pyruvate kinase
MGVKSLFYDKDDSTDRTVIDINDIAKEKGHVETGDHTINLASMPITEKGAILRARINPASINSPSLS